MAVTPVHLARITFNQRMFNMREGLRTAGRDLYNVQNDLVTGLRFTYASEDPQRAAAAAELDRRLETLETIKTNVGNVNGVMTEVESSAQEAMDIFSEAKALAIQVVSDASSPAERQSLVTVVDAMIDQLVAIGNRKYLNTYLWAGHESTAPFQRALEGVLYTGDGNRMETIVEEDMTSDYYTIPGMEFFKAVSAEVQGVMDLNPAVTAETRISDLNGTAGRGVSLGRIAITAGGTRQEIDLRNAATVGDVVDLLNAAIPGSVSAFITAQGITMTQPTAGPLVEISDVGGGTTARDLGLAGSFATASRSGPDIDPRVSSLTTIKSLFSGAGANLGSLRIRTGSSTATVDLSKAETIEDVLNQVNFAGVGAWAQVGTDGKSLQIRSRVSGVDLMIEEAGGNTATTLGVRSLHTNTQLSELNYGMGMRTATGDDIRIQTASGATIDVDLSGSVTLQDVISRFNAAAGGAVAVTQDTQGNGLVITDNTAGGGALSVTALNDSPAVRDLGLDEAVVGNQLTGRDPNPLRVESPFTALMELREGMLTDDRLLMQRAGERIERVLTEMQQVQGQAAAQAKVMGLRLDRAEAETTAATIMLSDVRDVDFSDATIRFQQMQMALEANLITAQQVMNLSLMDYLR
jgi:flagellar hook-associated protein 3 FlgL